MNGRTRYVILIVAAAVAVAGCSTEPTRQAAPPAAAPAAAATPAPGGVAPATREVPAGYRLEKRAGQELYCRSVVLIGSKFPEKKCFTREQIENLENNTESAMGEIERRIPVCGGAGSCNSGS
jgi:hypothetical protein